MTGAVSLLVALRRRGVHLRPDGDGLRYRAPKGTLTDADRDALRTHKPALLALLTDLATVEGDGIADRLRTLWATLSPAERARLDAEAAAGDTLAGILLVTVSGAAADGAEKGPAGHTGSALRG